MFDVEFSAVGSLLLCVDALPRIPDAFEVVPAKGWAMQNEWNILTKLEEKK